MFQLQAAAPESLQFVDLDGLPFELDLDTLAGLSEEGRDPVSGQRRPDITLPAGATVAEVRQVDGGWMVTLGSGQRLTLMNDRLSAHRDPDPWLVRPKPWSAADVADLSVYDYRGFMTDDDIRRRALRQMAVYGFIRLTGAPTAAGEIETLVTGFGLIRETNYGRIFDVKTKLNVANLADTALALAPHTDNPYRLSPPEIQILHCLAAAGSGGQSILVDGLAASEALKRDAPADFDLLCRTPARFSWTDGETFLEAEAPVISPERIRCNSRSFQAVVTDDPGLARAWTRAYDRFTALLAAPEAGLAFDMAAGDMVLMDNRRVLHGRTAFESAGGVDRHLQGAYSDMDGVYSTLRRLTQAHVDRELAALETLFESDALSPSYGEDISIRDHMLQSAEGAVARRLGPDLVAAALVHDIGWGMGGKHEAVAADRVAPILGEGVASLIRRHVDAKRYLVAVRPDYAEHLSPASVQTLKQQGGPMDADECRAFEALPDFELCLELRYLDEGGKELSAPETRFSHYRALLRSLMIRHALKV
jgi:gamma-butyrobetaine dioxygenase